MSTPLRIATRTSPLALVQAQWVCAQLTPHPTELIALSTAGDRHTDHPLHAQGGDKGWFVKELEQALLDGHADVAVHCIKDMPIQSPNGLNTPIICERTHPLDVLVGVSHPSQLPMQACIGTSSLRRASQWQHMHPKHRILPIRGNLQTRLKKLETGPFDALLLAQAGLVRLALDLPTYPLSPSDVLPAAGQGALGLQIRGEDKATQTLLQPLHCPTTALCVQAERRLIALLQAGCQSPVAALATYHDGMLSLEGCVGSNMRAQAQGHEAESLAANVFHALKAQGALDYLEQWS